MNEIRLLKCINNFIYVHLRLEDFPKKDHKVVVLFYPPGLK